MRRRRGSCGGVGVVLAAALLASCAEPSGGYGDYHDKAKETAKDVLSAIATAELASEQFRRGRATQAFTDVVVTNAENDASADQSTLDSRQPPDQRSDQLKNAVDQILQDATNALTDLRIAIRRNDGQGIDHALAELKQPLQKLRGLSQ